MPERQRAYRGEEVVTILKGKPGGRGKCDIRNAHGYEEKAVPAKTLVPVPEDEPHAVLHYGDPIS
jgi:hypothetical protein